MNARAQYALDSAVVHVATMRATAELVAARLNLAWSIEPPPEGMIDLVDDLTSLERGLERLHAQVKALAAGRALLQ